MACTDARQRVSERLDGEAPVGLNTTGNAKLALIWTTMHVPAISLPVFRGPAGMPVGADLGPLMSRVARAGADRQFRDQVRDLLWPGCSALFLIVSPAGLERVVDALGRFGGVVLKCVLNADRERELQEALHGQATIVPA